MMTYNTWVVLAGTSLLGACSGLVGCFAVLRRRALLGDALAHAALPGLCIAFLIVGERNVPAMLAGALATGLLGVGIVTGLRATTRVKEDAAIGIVLSVFYGAGIALSSAIQRRPTGGSTAGLDTYILGHTADMIRQEVYVIGGVSLLCLLLVILLYKEFKVVVFDPQFADVQGWPSFFVDLLLMGMIAVTVVIGLPAVGVVLMAAMLIIPAAAARFWTQQFAWLLPLAAVLGMLIGAGGTVTTANYRVAAGPAIVLVGTGIFLISLLLAPERGLIARLLSQAAFRTRIRRRALLQLIYELCEPALPDCRPIGGDEIRTRKAWEDREVNSILAGLDKEGLIFFENGDTFRLTPRGLEQGAALVRVVRLWELYLAEHTDAEVNFAELDEARLKELLPAEAIAGLVAELRSAGRWPEIDIARAKGAAG